MRKKQRKIHPDTIVLIKQIGIGLLVFAVLAAILTSIWFFTRWEKLTITTIDVVGGETIEHERVKDIVEESLSGNYLGFVPKRFNWLYPETDITNSLEQIDRMYDIKVERVAGKKILVSFKEYDPVALWCDAEDIYQCVFLDETGYAFAEAPSLKGGSFLRFVSLDKDVQVDDTPLESDVFLKLLRLTDLLAENNWYVSSIETDHVGDAFVQLVDGGELKIATADKPEEVVENLLVILTSDKFSHLEPGNFNYVDLRFGNRVFVNEEEESEEDDGEEVEMELTSTTTATSTN